MKKFVFILILLITCAGMLPAQVIDYTIDPSFNSESLLIKGSVTDILELQGSDYLISGNFFYPPSQITSGAIISSYGSLVDLANYGGIWINKYQDGFLRYGQPLVKFKISGVDYTFRFEFQKQLYSGPLSNIALDVLILENDNILVAGRFFTDSTLMNTNIESQGLRQLCLIDSLGKPVPGFPMVHCTQPIDAYIGKIDSLSDGSYIITGQFTEVNGYAYNNIAKLNSDFTVDTTFTNLFTSPSTLSLILVDSQDRIWVGGGPNVALQSNPDEAIRYTRLLSNGEIDSTFNRPLLQTLTGSNQDIPFDMSPYDIIEDTDGTFIFGGNFVYVNGNYHKCLVKVQDDGTVIEGAFTNLGADEASWPGYEPVSGAVAGTDLNKILKLPDGKLLIGGEFSSFGGEPYSCLVRLEPSGFVGIDEKEGRGKLKIYPNPAQSFITIKIPQGNDVINTVEIITVQGKLVKQIQNFNQDDKVSIVGLVAGIYIVTARTDSGVFTQKLVVE